MFASFLNSCSRVYILYDKIYKYTTQYNGAKHKKLYRSSTDTPIIHTQSVLILVYHPLSTPFATIPPRVLPTKYISSMRSRVRSACAFRSVGTARPNLERQRRNARTFRTTIYD